MFDNQSVALVLLPSLWASLVVLVMNWRIHRGMPGVGWWPAGLGLSTVGFMLRATAGLLSPWIAILASAVLIVGGQALMLRGLCAFAGRPMFTRSALATLALLAAAVTALLAMDAPEGARLSMVTTALAAVYVLKGRVLVEVARREGTAGVLVLAVTQALVVTLFTARCLMMLTGTVPIRLNFDEAAPTGLPTDVPRLLVFVNSSVLAVLIAYGYILLSTRRVQGQLARMARVDILTGVPNRLAFEEAMGRLQTAAGRGPGSVALALLDIDRFKQINDSHGHEVGDAMLRHVATLIGAALPPGGFLARIGGEEFAIALAGGGLADICDVAERIRQVVERTPLPVGERSLGVTISVGVAVVPPGAGGFHRLHRDADEALYRAKSQGRNCVVSAEAA